MKNKHKLFITAMLLAFVFSNTHAWRKDPCNDSQAICKKRGSQKVCGYRGESFRSCGSSIDFRPRNRIEAPKRKSKQDLYQECWEKVQGKYAKKYGRGAQSMKGAKIGLELRLKCGKRP